jgi:hypothetical protein
MDADVNGARNSWDGARHEEVVAQWGVPVRNATQADGRESYTWVSEGMVSSGPGFPFAIFGSNRGVGVGTVFGGGPGSSELARCERTLIFRDGSVVEQTWQGHARYCSTFRRK